MINQNDREVEMKTLLAIFWTAGAGIISYMTWPYGAVAFGFVTGAVLENVRALHSARRNRLQNADQPQNKPPVSVSVAVSIEGVPQQLQNRPNVDPHLNLAPSAPSATISTPAPGGPIIYQFGASAEGVPNVINEPRNPEIRTGMAAKK